MGKRTPEQDIRLTVPMAWAMPDKAITGVPSPVSSLQIRSSKRSSLPADRSLWLLHPFAKLHKMPLYRIGTGSISFSRATHRIFEPPVLAMDTGDRRTADPASHRDEAIDLLGKL